MKRIKCSPFLAVSMFVLMICSGGYSFTFTHPGGFNTKQELDFIKQKVNANQNPWKAAFDKMRNNRWGKMTYSHKAYREVKCGSHNNPNVGCNEMVYDAMAAYNQALQWYITGDKKHADKAMRILNDWASTYVRNTDFNDKLVASWATPWFVNAAEIIRYSGAGWSTKDINQFKSMLDKLWYFATYGAMMNNGLQSQIEAQMAIGIFLDDKAKFDRAVSEWKKYTRTYIYMKKDGSQPIKGRRDIQSAWSGTKVFLEGMAQETCRDYGHSVLGIRSMIGAATMAYSQGVDLFALEKDRIAANIELTASWILREKSVPNTICQGRGVDCKGGNNSPKMPACPKRGWEVAYRHLHNRLGIRMPMALRMINDVKVQDMSRWNEKPETLTAHGIPFGNNTNPPPPQTHTLTTTVHGTGTITRSSNGPNYAAGTEVTLTAAPAAGMVFNGWNGDLSGDTNPAKITLSANRTVIANFTQALPSGATRLPIVAADASAEQEGNPKEHAFDEKQDTRWANDNTAENNWITFDLGEPNTVKAVRLMLNVGETRSYPLKIEVGDNTFTEVWSGTLPPTIGLHTIAVTEKTGRYVRISMTDANSDNSNWFSIFQAEVWGQSSSTSVTLFNGSAKNPLTIIPQVGGITVRAGQVPIHLEILNLKGKVIYSKSTVAENSFIPVSTSGVHFIRLRHNGQEVTQRVVILN